MLIGELALHLVHVQNLVPGERHVGIDVIVESAPCRFLPPQGDFVTVIVHFADIQRGQARRNNARGRVRRQENARTVFKEIIEIQGKPIREEVCVDTVVLLVGRFPCYIGIAQRTFPVSFQTVRVVNTKAIRAVL